MKKDDLKSLVTQMHKELLENIDSQESANKAQIIDYLQNAIATIRKIDDTKIDSVESAKLAFSNGYKEIATQSLNSYKETNGQFEAISILHQSTLEEAREYLIDIPAISAKFTEVQEYMTKEVKKANEVISQLNAQIKLLEENTTLDGLTKVFNRRALDQYLDNITKKGVLQHDLYLLILDIDDFKNINDNYGHIVGDKILIFIANLLRKTLRDGDKVFRYGGEEFIIILNRITESKCEEIAKRILDTVNANTLFYKGHSVNVTLSIGVTKYFSGDTPDDLIERADRALYRSKEYGKNQLNMEFKNGN